MNVFTSKTIFYLYQLIQYDILPGPFSFWEEVNMEGDYLVSGRSFHHVYKFRYSSIEGVTCLYKYKDSNLYFLLIEEAELSNNDFKNLFDILEYRNNYFYSVIENYNKYNNSNGITIDEIKNEDEKNITGIFKRILRYRISRQYDENDNKIIPDIIHLGLFHTNKDSEFVFKISNKKKKQVTFKKCVVIIHNNGEKEIIIHQEVHLKMIYYCNNNIKDHIFHKTDGPTVIDYNNNVKYYHISNNIVSQDVVEWIKNNNVEFDEDFNFKNEQDYLVFKLKYLK